MIQNQFDGVGGRHTAWSIAAKIVGWATTLTVALAVWVVPPVISPCRAADPATTLPAPTSWDPLAPPTREIDTLFLPDFTSWQMIERDGGFLMGDGKETSEQVKDRYEFGPGKFGPAVKAKAGKQWTFINYPQDGLLSEDEFTIQFWARSEGSWSTAQAPVFSVRGTAGNRFDLRPDKDDLVLRFQTPAGQKMWRGKRQELGLSDDGWHAFALTLKAGSLRVYVDGKSGGGLDKLPALPAWTDGGQMGISLCGEAHGAGDYWVSDFRISRTARTPGQIPALRSLTGRLDIDAGKTLPDSALPRVGGLHPYGTPLQTRAALHVIRTDKILSATPIKRGEPDAEYPARGVSGRFSYDWQVCDRVFDWMKEHGVEPSISIDATPSVLGGRVKPFSGNDLKEKLSKSSGFGPDQPNNLDDWAAIVQDLVHHVVKERGERVPWWGVWNEPDFKPFWNGGIKQYLDLYAVTAKAVRAADPSARVGGPETSAFRDDWIQQLIDRCAAEKLPLDYISYHDYAGNLGTLEDVRKKVDTWAAARGLTTAGSHFPIVVGEFNWESHHLYKTGTARYNKGMWHLRAFDAAYTTAFLTRMTELGGYELLVYSHTGYGDPRQGSWNSTQLIGPKGEQWAPFNALAGWKKVAAGNVLAMQKDLPPGVYALATVDSASQRIGIVLTNYGYAQRQEREIQIAVSGLAPGSWRQERYVVSPAHSSRWDLAEDREEGAKANDLELVEQQAMMVTAGQPASVSVTLAPWSSTFVALNPTK